MVKRIKDNRGLFFDQIAELLDRIDDAEFPKRFAKFVTQWIPAHSLGLIEFRTDVQPRVIYTYGTEDYDSDLKRYLSGIYLLDPIYNLYKLSDRRGVVHVSVEQLDLHERTRVYSSYFRQIGANNEVGSLHQINDEVCVHLSILIEDAHDDQLERVINVMTDLEKLTTSLFSKHFSSAKPASLPDLSDRRALHKQVSDTLDRFGEDHLTERESEIAQCLLRGHSAKSMARLLDLSPGTISIHRSNVYRKMNVGSQAELSSLFLEQLMGPSAPVTAKA